MNYGGAQQSFKGLETLTSIGRNLRIQNTSLSSFDGLSGLTSIGGNFEVKYSNIQNFLGLEGLQSIGGDFNLFINEKLTSLKGLGNVNFSGNNFFGISVSKSLSDCAVTSVCTYLSNFSISNIGNIYISGNATGCNSVSQITTVCNGGSLPVTLLNFNAKKTVEGNVLTWQTTSETQNSGFDIERSFNAKSFEKISFVYGNGDTKQTQNYSFTDYKPGLLSYYRLKQLDFDGTFSYSKIIAVNAGKEIVKVYPNPSGGQLYIETTNRNQPYSIKNVQGFSLMESAVLPSKELDTSSLQNGLYLLTVGKEVFKVMVNN